MAMFLNIAGATPIEDPEYRYKMPRIVGKVEGRGNGIKTAIPNMTQVALSLHRPPGEVTKFFGCELGAQTTWTEETERAIVNGAHATNVLQEKLSVYIEKFVLCPACKLPETNYKIKSDMIYHQCVACGAREAVDMQHKLTTYILKVNKLAKKGSKDKKKKKDKDETSDKKVKKKKKKKEDETEEERAERKRKKKEKKASKEKKEEEGQDNNNNDSDDDDDSANNNNNNNDSDDDDENDDDDDFEDDASAMKSAISGIRAKLESGASGVELAGETRAVQTFCALPRNERAYILLAALYSTDAEKRLVAKPSDRDLEVLGALKADVGHLGLIGGLEKIAVLTDIVPKFPIILKHLYDLDLLEEVQILDWAKDSSDNKDTDVPALLTQDLRNALFKASEPFVVWLQQADEEDDDDTSDDEEG